MRIQSVSQTNAGSSQVIPMNLDSTPFNVGFGVVINSGTPTYSVQHTFDNVLDPTVTPTWFTHPTVATQTTNQDGNYAFPVAAIKLVITTGSGTATMNLIQAGIA